MGELFQGAGGSIFEIDLPAPGTMARRTHDQRVAKGELIPVSGPVEQVTTPEGGVLLVAGEGTVVGPVPQPEPAPEPTASDQAPAEPDPDDEDPDDDDEGADDAAAVPDGSVADVLEWVDGDTARAHQALAAERAGKNRSSLVTQLEQLTAS